MGPRLELTVGTYTNCEPRLFSGFQKIHGSHRSILNMTDGLMLVTAERSTKESVCACSPYNPYFSPILSTEPMPPLLGYCSPGEGQGSVPGFTQFPSAMRMFILVSRISYTNRTSITEFMAFLNIEVEDKWIMLQWDALYRYLLSGSVLASLVLPEQRRRLFLEISFVVLLFDYALHWNCEH